MFQYQARDKALELMKQHGLLEKGWKFGFDNAKRRNGACEYGIKTIWLSRHYVKLNSEELIIDTILHEIAHALTPRDAGHGPVWKAKCAEIGALPMAVKKGMGIKQVEGKWKATCNGCEKVYSRHRKPQTKARYSCPDCSGTRFNWRFELIFKKED